ncbi:hypothetical protein FZCC0069_10230 [Rhodobacterales bacterium FZCC0069]|nr:hypothetical protein [Rhodobacterales bacterium FZCC0069]
MSFALQSALARCKVDPRKSGMYEVQLERAADRYRHDVKLEADRAELGARVSYKELNRFKDALRRDTSAAKLQERWHKLNDSTQVFVSMHYKRQTGVVLSFEDLDLSLKADKEALHSAMTGATTWLGNKPGHEYPIPLLDLVRAAIFVYEAATGKKPGVSSETTRAGMNYTTPLEDLVIATLALIDKNDLAFDGYRSLIRAVIKDKRQR